MTSCCLGEKKKTLEEILLTAVYFHKIALIIFTVMNMTVFLNVSFENTAVFILDYLKHNGCAARQKVKVETFQGFFWVLIPGYLDAAISAHITAKS